MCPERKIYQATLPFFVSPKAFLFYMKAGYWVIRCTNLGYTRTTFETPKYLRRPRDQYTAQIVNTLELSGPHQIELKKPLQPGEVSNNKYMYICSSKKWSHCETVALWNSLGTCKISSIPMPCHWKPNCQRRSSLSLVAIFSVDTTRLPCAFAPIVMVRSYFQYCCQSI